MLQSQPNNVITKHQILIVRNNIKFKMNQLKAIIIFGLVLFLFTGAQSQNQQTQQDQIDKQSEYIQQFAKTMADFIPTQTFLFQLQVGQQQNFAIWIRQQDIQKIRGVFYVDNAEAGSDATGKGLFVGCQVNGHIVKSFIDERLGVFNFDHQRQTGSYKLIFKAQTQPLTIYVSYQLKKLTTNSEVKNKRSDQNVPTQAQENLLQKKSELIEVHQKFGKVKTVLQSQQNYIRQIMKHTIKQGKRIQKNIQYAHIRIISETVLVLLSGLLGMWLLKKQLNNGYISLV